MEKIKNSFHILSEMNKDYGLSNETIDKLLKEIDTAKVNIPLIGKFSSGKSALINTILKYNKKLLKEDITPETAVPTEIVYSPNKKTAVIIKNDDTSQKIGIDEYHSFHTDVSTTKYIRLYLQNDRLKLIPDIILVDLPGFESGIEIHNKAIDGYSSKSLAYIITFPADDMNVLNSIGEVLRELCHYNMRLCVVITKFDKHNDSYEESLENLKNTLKKFVGEREIFYCKTSSFNKNSEELEEFLQRMQKMSKTILANKYRNNVLAEANKLKGYFNTTLKSSAMTESELAEQKEKLDKQLINLENEFKAKREEFDLEISECVEQIKSDVQSNLTQMDSTLITMVLNHQDINDRLNTAVRRSVSSSVKNRFVPKVEKYLKEIKNKIGGDTFDGVHVEIGLDLDNVGNEVVLSAVKGVAAFLALQIHPVLAALVLGICSIIEKFLKSNKREEVKSKIRSQLHSDVYPKVMDAVENGVQSEITKQVTDINRFIQESIDTQRDTLMKAIEDTRKKMEEEKEEKERLVKKITEDLKRIEEIQNGL